MGHATFTRKNFLLGAGAIAGAIGLSSRPAYARRPRVIKFGLDLPLDHPTTKNVALAGKRIEEETKGRVKLELFPNNELGDDTHMLSEVRSGAIQMMGIGDNILSGLVPEAAIDSLGFTFKNADMAWTALDGKVGDVVCAAIKTHGLYPMRRIWDEGFREITSSTKPIKVPADLLNFKIRVPPSPISVSLFQHLGAAATSINRAELYSALQTKVVDGQENPLGLIETQKFYQVQKYCSLTNHMWVGYWLIAGAGFWESLPAEDRQIVEAALNDQAATQRQQNEALNQSTKAELIAQGMVFNDTDPAAFRAVLVKSGFYSEWQKKFDPALWAALEHYTGKLA